ncbi:MAG TPA: YggS family pyridoxal phosphate-dependent enzyme [Desulfobacteraceae bacterium]|nr:YggS family pyridoxal phosphate-dependent enzyme [Desulfobacteraceae bacterium]
MQIQNNIDRIQASIRTTAERCGRNPDDIQLIGVSKRKPAGLIRDAIAAGHKNFGENYIQEAMEKIDELGRDAACWHFIGHLQSNKAKFAVKYFDLIHTVDKLKLAKEINKQAAKIGKVQQVLLQINIAQEDTKSGAAAGEVLDLARSISQFDHLSLQGLMCMPPFFDDPEEARPYFRAVRIIKDEIAGMNLPGVEMNHLSMGMSNDYAVAIEEGATLVRVGTAIFGRRD